AEVEDGGGLHHAPDGKAVGEIGSAGGGSRQPAANEGAKNPGASNEKLRGEGGAGDVGLEGLPVGKIDIGGQRVKRHGCPLDGGGDGECREECNIRRAACVARG